MESHKKHVLLYFGSFNPVHIGHLIIAQYATEYSKSDELWFVVSPHNPLKDSNIISDQTDRKNMLELAINKYVLNSCMVCDVEFTMSRPSYTIDTLKKLSALHPNTYFNIVMGEDNIAVFDLWKDFTEILSMVKIYVFRRNNCEYSNKSKDIISRYDNIIFMDDIPMLDISSSLVRDRIEKGLDFSTMVPIGIPQYIEENGLYTFINRKDR